jgi:hypothetical protein
LRIGKILAEGARVEAVDVHHERIDLREREFHRVRDAALDGKLREEDAEEEQE